MSYKKRTKADENFKEGGYKNVVLFAQTSAVTSMARPTSTPSVQGDKVKITTAHTFSAGEGFISLVCKKHSVTSTSETTGDDGSKSLTHKAKFIILGDDASTLEGMQDMLNDDLFFLIKDQDCLNTSAYTQFGDDCLSVDVTVAFDGKTTKEGLKEYTVEISVKGKKFFYSGAVSEKPSTSTVGNPTVMNVTAGYTGAVGSSIFLAVDANPAGNAAIRTLTYVWKKGGTQVSGFSDYYVKFNAQTNDSGSYTCEVTDAYSHTVVSTPMTVTIT